MKQTKLESIEYTITLLVTNKLDGHPDIVASNFERLIDIMNGCGAAGAKFDFVPDTIYGLSIKPACNIHDYDYHVGTSIVYKKMADRRFFNNMFRLIDLSSKNKFMKWARRKRALKYYNAVDMMGGKAFWDGKNK